MKALFAAAILGILPMLIGAAEPARAGCAIEAPGFFAAEIRVGVELDGLAPSPGGSYGSALYGASNGAVLRIDPVSGKFHKFAVKLAGGGHRPSGLAFDRGTFATGLLYAVQNAGSVVTVSPSGNVASFSAAGTLFSSNDLAFAPPGSAFGNHLFVSNGTFGPGNVSKINAEGANSLFAPTKTFARAPNGLAFAPPKSVFGNNLFAGLPDGTVLEISPDANTKTLAKGLGLAIDLAFSAGGEFGDFLYVTDPRSRSILKIDSAGNVKRFAKNCAFSRSGFDADIAFSIDGAALFVADGRSLLVIRHSAHAAEAAPGSSR